MNTKLTGIINEGDTREFMERIENLMGSRSDIKSDIAGIRSEISQIRQTVDILHKKIDHIEQILEKVSD